MTFEKTPKCGRCSLGFSLIELIVVTLVISILASVAIPRLSAALTSRRLQAATRRIAADFAYARNAAKDTGKSVQVEYSAGTGVYSMPTIPSPNGDASYVVDLLQTPYPVTIASVDFGGDSTIIFDLYGHADSGGTLSISGAGQTTNLSFSQLSGKTTVVP